VREPRARWSARMLGVGGAIFVLVLSGCFAGQAAETSSAEPLAALDRSEVARGREVYVQRCASCHGQDARGASNWRQPDSLGNLPAPPHDDSGHTWRHGDAQLAEIINDGWRDPFNKTPDLTMPPFRDQLDQEQVRAVISYFKSLWTDEHRRYQQERTRVETTATGVPLP